MSHRITWLASYPKSGNTWVRALLTHYRDRRDGTVDLNALIGGPIASARDEFDKWAGVPASDLSREQIDALRVDLYRWRAATASDSLVIKVHDAWTYLPDGQPLFPAEVSRGVIYIVRHPADVAVSYAAHAGISTAVAVDRLCTPSLTIADRPDRLERQLPQTLLSWSSHVDSWCGQTAIPIELVRYEDLLADPIRTLESVVRFLGWDVDQARLGASVRACHFEALQRQEQQFGFNERPADSSACFFRHGRAGNGRALLTDSQWRQLAGEHREVMMRLGYLEEV